ncbi:multiple sugar transport system permease protein [Clostridium collagenovorans DSM 3089]|uniref:Multiple sugar transport system permease protein n=1 Tax=Clostridium collagenovorans DSM 3089 TaxID=1121306 RepID=A0A1M5WMP9_9CLOT|nr:sugar ABC transporter permease [Clostridium collagenovorans]SHH88807.1 multiple sugar transport system permease protein [Clostridium collagenovorans DSM 3089]
MKKSSIKNKKTLKKYLKSIFPYGYIIPIGIIIVAFSVLPIIMSIFFSFTKYNIMQPPEFIGLENYKSLFTDKALMESIKNTIRFSVVTVPIQTILSLLLATWVVRGTSGRISNIVKGAFFIPVLSSMVLIGMVWKSLLNGDASPINQFLGLFGLNAANWLGSSKTALNTLMMIAVWKNVGYFMVLYIAALMDIPNSYYEAAKVDGSSTWRVLKDITVPLLKPTTIMIVFLGIIRSLQVFDLVYTLTGGGPGMSTMTVVMHAYNLNFKSFNSGYAMAVANVLFLIIAIISILQKTLLKRDKSSL